MGILGEFLMVYIWKISDDYPERLIGEYDRKNSPDRFIFKRGEVLPPDILSPTIIFDVRTCELNAIDDLASNAMVPIISNRLAAELSDFALQDIQLIDVNIKAKDGVIDGYKLLNVVSKVVGIDKSNSIYTLVPGSEQIMSFRRVKYKDDCLGSHHLARDSEYSSNLIVSDVLAERLFNMKLKGVGLYHPEEIRW
ncbi:imm11 family protein [Shewanella algae]|uniref:imm11 family protein n=2 Tax=Shewanella algae TaxID=38313 RepID=UPI000D1B0699|nr:DUF1629 domain-containing protein [Shewanella algae]PSS73171.1 hypothetical protein AYI88_08070 [Shewanella algae]